jgi:ribonuclease HI
VAGLYTSQTHWDAPPKDWFKLNFDGASKGNPGPIGYGAIIRNDKGEIIHILAGNMGQNTNNAMKIWSLLCGLQATTKLELFPLIVEGDLQIVINLLKHLINGTDLEKMYPRWRLMNRHCRIKSILRHRHVILPSHVRRTTNQVADWLDNMGVELGDEVFSCSPDTNPMHPTVIACKNLAHTKY